MAKVVFRLLSTRKILPHSSIRCMYNMHQMMERNFENIQVNLFDCKKIHSSKWFCQNVAVNCWKCGKERKSIKELFCDKCNIVQNPHEYENFFTVFDLSEEFDLDSKLLTKKYREMQTLLHPDKFSNRSEQEKEISEKYSSLVNKAYNTLQIPLKRAIHMLSLHNEKIDEKNEVSDKHFLMEIMELNEEIEDADTPEKLKLLDQKNKKFINEITREISKYFSENNIPKAKDSIIKMKYYDSINGRINNILREKGIVD